MLHTIEVPACRSQLEWIVELQRRLLTALCNPTITGANVCVDWLLTQCPDLERKWLEAFCQRKDQVPRVKRPMLNHMQAIADLPPADKQALLDAFDNDQEFHLEFTAPTTTPHRFKGLLPFGTQQSTTAAIRGFFESFYAPNFYADYGYVIPQPSGNSLNLDKDKFLTEFDIANSNVQVCPLCDGQRTDPQVDHFYPKSHYPYLSCHPLNLVPICIECNLASNKGSKKPVSSATNEKADWLHPYLRPATGQYSIGFESATNGATPILSGANRRLQKQLENLQGLVNLKRRWRIRLRSCVGAALSKIAKHNARNGRSMSKAELTEKLHDWADSAEAEIGLQPGCLVETAYYNYAATETPLFFDELWIKNSKTDAVTT